jgi:hypothetical protein
VGFLTETERTALAAVVDRLIPPRGDHLGAAALGAVDYIDTLLDAFSSEPPRIWAGGPFSGRAGGEAGFDQFHDLSRVEALTWRTRIEGSRSIPEREWNGPVRGWQEIYRGGLAALGNDYSTMDPKEQAARLAAERELARLAYEHACEACYGAPEYGGNRDLGGWTAVNFPGDVQPRGYTDAEVTNP